MHKITRKLFDKSLGLPYSLPEYEGSRGIAFIHEFNAGYLFPMFGIAAPNHALYAPKIIFTKKKTEISDYYIPLSKELETAIMVDKFVKNGLLLAPDMALDPDWPDELIIEADKELRIIIEKLLQVGIKRVAVWSNNGIGDETTLESDKDGVIRDENNLAYATRLYGEVKETYQGTRNKPIPNSYQNSAHAHYHILPLDVGNKFDEKLLTALNGIHSEKDEGVTLLHYKEMMKSQHNEKSPFISVCIFDIKKSRIDHPLSFTHFNGLQNMLAGYTMSGFVRALALGYSKNVTNIDFEDKATKKEYLGLTQVFYDEVVLS